MIDIQKFGARSNLEGRGKKWFTRHNIEVWIVIAVITTLVNDIPVYVFPILQTPQFYILNPDILDERVCNGTTLLGGHIFVVFDVLNTGGDGWAKVSFYIHGSFDHSWVHFVPSHQTISEQKPIYITGTCNPVLLDFVVNVTGSSKLYPP